MEGSGGNSDGTKHRSRIYPRISKHLWLRESAGPNILFDLHLCGEVLANISTRNYLSKTTLFRALGARHMQDDLTEIGPSRADIVAYTADIVQAQIANNHTSADEVPGLITKVFAALAALADKPDQIEEPLQKPAVAIKSSVKDDHVICLEDGKKLKTLKRHLAAEHGMTAEQYRAKWELPDTYPMVAPSFSNERRKHAKNIGFGRKAGQTRGRKRKSAEQ